MDYQLNGHEFMQTLRATEEQGSLSQRVRHDLVTEYLTS